MRLYEIISFEPKSSNQNRYSYTDRLKKAGAAELGGGCFGQALQGKSGKRLNQIAKVGRAGTISTMTDNPKEDAYLSYIRAVQDFEENGGHNLYFPKIHDLKILKTKDDTIDYRANIEKLVNFHSPRIVENEDLMKSLYQYMFKTQESPYGGNAEQMIDNMRWALKSYSFDRIRDPKLVEALKLIADVRDNGPRTFNEDFHSGNFMWRITGTMPHLVILDPLS